MQKQVGFVGIWVMGGWGGGQQKQGLSGQHLSKNRHVADLEEMLSLMGTLEYFDIDVKQCKILEEATAA